MPFLLPRKDDVFALHARALDEFGGTQGLRDEGALESALAAAENREHYEQADLAACAATYAYHLSQAHAFVDGNKRVALAVAEVFLKVNDAELRATNEEVTDLFMKIAAGELSRDEVEQFFKRRVAMR